MKKSKSNKPIVRCASCQHADLHKWGSDPVIAHCNVMHEREVANQDRVCMRYIEENNKQIIQHYD